MCSCSVSSCISSARGIVLDASRVVALDPQADVAGIRAYLDLIPRIVAGGQEAGEIGLLPLPERFRWLASPRNTIVQPSTVHPGLCTDPQAALDPDLHTGSCRLRVDPNPQLNHEASVQS